MNSKKDIERERFIEREKERWRDREREMERERKRYSVRDPNCGILLGIQITVF